MRLILLSLLLLTACGSGDGTFKGTFDPPSGAQPADLSAFEAETVNIVQYKLAHCSGGFLSSGSNCKLTYWENDDSSVSPDVKKRQIVFRMNGYPEEGLSFPVKSTDGGVAISVQYLESPSHETNPDDLPPNWDAVSGTVTTTSVSDKGFKFHAQDVAFPGGFTLNGDGELYAPPPPKQ